MDFEQWNDYNFSLQNIADLAFFTAKLWKVTGKKRCSKVNVREMNLCVPAFLALDKLYA